MSSAASRRQRREKSQAARAAAEKAAAILLAVERQGDAAVIELEASLDGASLTPQTLAVPPAELESAREDLAPQLAEDLALAISRVRSFYEATRLPLFAASAGCTWRRLPLARVGVYVPAGRAALFSSAIMCAVPAQVAGVPEIALFSPPTENGEVSRTILATAALLGVREVYRVGGAQAIAAAAFGTEHIPRVDKIVGPGNLYVTEAKRLVSDRVGIDSLAGPSEVMILAGPGAPPDQLALDLLAQAEHDPEATAVLVSWSADLIGAVRREIDGLLSEHPDSVAKVSFERHGELLQVAGPDEAIALANEYAPEHLELFFDGAEQALTRIRTAGAIFVGQPTPLGDYIAGPSHVLPTAGSARFASCLGVEDFLRRTSVVSAGPDFPYAAAARLAAAEGLSFHEKALLHHASAGGFPERSG